MFLFVCFVVVDVVSYLGFFFSSNISLDLNNPPAVTSCHSITNQGRLRSNN